MSFNLTDVITNFYLAIGDPKPGSMASRITINYLIPLLTYVIRTINEESPFVQHTVISVTNGTRQYALPSDFISETSVRYRGFPLRRSVTQDYSFLISSVTSYPWQYDIFYPGTSNSQITPTGVPYVILDPAPSETSSGSVPLFPGFNDPFLMVTYIARIPTDFTISNYTTYSFNLAEEYMPLITDLCVARVASLDGNTEVFRETLLMVQDRIKKLNSYVLSLGENNPIQVNDVYF